MTPSEFKAWFDGFTEAFTGCPTKAQWTRIKARVAEIDGKPITHTVYVDRYVRPYWTYLGGGVCTTGGISSGATGGSYAPALTNCSNQIGSVGAAFNSSQAMADLGRYEAALNG